MPSPARQQYLEIKRRHQDDILMFRLGDFYEMFDEDAEIAARLLGLQLTARNYPRGEGRVPMAGVPHHSVHGYIKRLIDAGHRVALCEQLTPPGKGIVERDVVRIFTPGTIVEPDLLRPEENNYLAAVHRGKMTAGLAYVDVSTGEFLACELPRADGESLDAELLRLAPAECLLVVDADTPPRLPAGCARAGFKTPLDRKGALRVLTDHFGPASVAAMGLEDQNQAIVAAAMILEYLRGTNREVLTLVAALRRYAPGRHMTLDRFTRDSLDLIPAPGGGGRRWTLLRVLDRTKTGMGARFLRAMVSQPLLDLLEIEHRLDIVQTLVQSPSTVRKLESRLMAVGDVERIAGRVIQGRGHASDLIQLRLSLVAAAGVKETVTGETGLDELAAGVDPCLDLCSRVETALDAGGGAVVKPGYSLKLDAARATVAGSRAAMAELERREAAATGVRGLRVGYNKVFGYYFEVGKAAAELPERFVRQQTLLNAERYMTAELKALESAILEAQADAEQLETAVLDELIQDVVRSRSSVMSTAATVAEIDAFRALADVALANNYVRPRIDETRDLEIHGGRHPVVEVADRDRAFVPNDCVFDSEQRIIVLTGPNMGGKSTMLRTVALIVLLGQIGSFVPAESATIGIVDRVFSRVGAQDDIAAGHSTFMTEMIETANILHNATSRSLLILDEIGRGTSTYDGLAIARSVTEHVHARIEARTLFATHYHELAALEDELTHVRNFHTEIAEHDGAVIFLHRILPGSADRSYGIHVARLAGLPHSVTVRADRLLRQLEKSANGSRGGPGPQLALFSDPDLAPRSEVEEAAVRILDEILALDLSNTTPLEALERLHRLQTEGRSSR